MAIITFKFTFPPGFTPEVEVFRADTIVSLGSETATETDALGHYTVDIDIGSYTGDVLVSTVPDGAYYGTIGTGDCQLLDQPYDAQLSTILAQLQALIPIVPTPDTEPASTTIYYYNGEVGVTKAIATTDYTALDIEIAIELLTKVDVEVVPNASLTKTSTSVTFVLPTSVTTLVRKYKYSIRKTTGKEVLYEGDIVGKYSPLSP